ncbi:MAG: peptidylprolyl isomerase [Verrucomicrobia bacterium]|nr:peptidylprolyl isomerase [Verrucomicrobiota bacterium]
MKSIFLKLAVVLSGVTVAWAQDPAPKAKFSLEELFPDKVVAKGKGFEIKSSQVEKEFTEFKTSMAAQGRVVPEDQRRDFEAKILERLSISKILDTKATAEDRAKATESVDKYIAELRKRAASEESFRRQVEATGLTPEQFRQKIVERAVIEEVFNREVKASLKASDEEIKKFYEDNKAKFMEPEAVKVSHILRLVVDMTKPGPGGVPAEMPTEKKAAQRELADNILKRLKAGEDFAKLATEFSEDPGSKERGGVMVIARGQMSSDFEAAVFALGANQISEVITSKYGYHILRVDERLPAKQFTLEETKGRIREHLIQQEAEKLLPGYVERLKKEAGLEILDARYKP